jgi:predicted signal transduction protein with EAL and GGDEF domain
MSRERPAHRESFAVASNITEALATPRWIDNRQVTIAASMSISIYPDNATDIDILMQQADAAMYRARQIGRCTHRFFSADMNRLAEQRLVYSAALCQANASDGLTLHYQPQTRTIGGVLYRVEARWPALYSARSLPSSSSRC